MSSPAPTPVLDTKRGKQILMLLLAVAFLDFVDASIVNVALPSIRRDLGFTEQGLQWFPSAYLLTYGGVVLLGRPDRRPAGAGGWRCDDAPSSALDPHHLLQGGARPQHGARHLGWHGRTC